MLIIAQHTTTHEQPLYIVYCNDIFHEFLINSKDISTSIIGPEITCQEDIPALVSYARFMPNVERFLKPIASCWGPEMDSYVGEMFWRKASLGKHFDQNPS